MGFLLSVFADFWLNAPETIRKDGEICFAVTFLFKYYEPICSKDPNSQFSEKKMANSKGLFITCEGGEGVGKSSFFEKLHLALTKKGLDVVKTREPGGSPVAEAIRSIFNNPPSGEKLAAESEFFLVSAARVQHLLSKVVPNLDAGKWVLCDRFTDSSLVYQGILGGLPRDFMNAVNRVASFNLVPHTTFLLDCPVEVSLSRVTKRNIENSQDTRYDRADRSYHVKIREAYLQLAEEFKSRYVILDSQRSTDDLVKDALIKLEERSAFKK